jgi:hypothetical protein
MKAPRYVATAEGNLVDKKKGGQIDVAAFDLVQAGKIQVIKIEDRAGKKYRIARYMIDETAFSFGQNGFTQEGKRAASTPATKVTTALVHASQVPPMNAIVMTRDELLQIHGALQSAADLTLRKVVESLRN